MYSLRIMAQAVDHHIGRVKITQKKALLVNWDNYPNNPTGGVYVREKALILELHERAMHNHLR
jgi:aspartate/methionine/tyrosine aminotransferase